MTVIINESDTVLIVAQPQNSLIVGVGIQGVAGIGGNVTGITGFTNANGFTGNVSGNNLSLTLQNANATQSGQLTSSDWTIFNGSVGNVTALQSNVSDHIGNYTNPHNVTKSQVGLSNVTDVAPLELPVSNATQTALNGKQDTLVSGTNIKTINSVSLLGSGDIVITAGNVTGLTGFTDGNGFTGSVIDNNLSLVLQNANDTQSGQITSGKYTDWENKGTSNLTLGNTSTTALKGNATTADVAASTNKNYVTDGNLAVINQTSGTNTGDQDLSGLVPKTTTINGVNLSANITLTTANVSASTNKNYVTDAGLAVLNATSGTNTGDQDLSGYVPTARTVNGQNLTANITTTHASNSGLGWTSAGHTGGNTVLAGFNATGVAAEYSLSGSGTTILTNNSAAFGTPASGNLTNCSGVAANLTAGAVSSINVSGTVTGALPVANGGTGLTSFLSNINGFRLTLTSGTPVTTADVTGATTIYCTPYNGNAIALYDGTRWNVRQSAQFSIALGTLTNAIGYDVFCYDNAGTPTLELTAWSSATARATALVYQDGVLSKSGATTRRYLGSFFTTSTTTTADSAASRYLFNYSNQVKRQLKVTESAASWTIVTSATMRQANANAANQVNVFVGVEEEPIHVAVKIGQCSSNNATATGTIVTIGLDSTTSQSSLATTGRFFPAAGLVVSSMEAEFNGFTGLGKHSLMWLEQGNASSTITMTTFTPSSGLFGYIYG